jgi:hypothetical protein
MPRIFVRTAVAATALATAAALAATPALAQRAASSTVASGASAPLVQFTPYAGYMFFGDFVKGPVGTSISSASGPMYGAQLGVNLTPNVALIGNVARASGDLKVGIPFLGGVSVGQSSAWMYDAGIQLGTSLATSRLPVAPFVQLGAGAIRFTVGGSVLTTIATNFGANAGLGADIGLGSGISLRILAKDYIGKFDVQQATSLDVQGTTSHNIGLSGGLKVEF